MNTRSLSALLGASMLAGVNLSAVDVPVVSWRIQSTQAGDFPPAHVGDKVSTLILDIDQNGINDIVIAGWGEPSMIWYRNTGDGWEQYVIDEGVEYIEAGGDFYDIDGDGDLDIVQGGDWRTLKEVWWWENPHPNFKKEVPWKRHFVKNSDEGGKSHHDQIFGDFLGTGTDQLVFWNNHGGNLFLAEIPDDVRNAPAWLLHPIYTFEVPEERKVEGLAKGDIDGDGKLDIIGAGLWFKHVGETEFEVFDIDSDFYYSRSGVGDFVKGGRPEIVMSPGDTEGPLNWYEWDGAQWITRNLIDVVHRGHTLQVADFNRDGNDDIFCAEMHTPGRGDDCEMWIFYGDGQGNFKKTVLRTGVGNHESKVGDLNGDGLPDIVQKPFRHAPGRIDIWINQGAGN